MLIRATKSATRALMESFPSQNGNLVQFAPHASGPLGTPIGLLGGAGGRLQEERGGNVCVRGGG
jgi:hypothetical protein